MKKYTWHKVADTIDQIHFSSEGLAEIEVEGKTICIAMKNGELFGCAQDCPHAGGQMAEGFIDAAGNIVCPLHHIKFDLKNGRNTSGEGYYLKVYPAKVNSDGVFVGIEKPGGLFGWIK